MRNSLKSAIRKAIQESSNFNVVYIDIDMPERGDEIGQMLINITTRKKKRKRTPSSPITK